ncbi:restriction endonuclease subunit S [Escherichia coli]|uniref:restriction endonuclease subunit S n=1 Tax=Escherichia coli TaxID=562 RepID=UPI0010AD4F41|nr:restriction endonuclease subunit S [Escherichia coli]EET0019008.1 restriction endonuclease subunit S [Escherichia coli]EET5525960.1 restriction endonuclease subunit S [Escherichia coli]EEU0348461.1 restriction endonuclease subunit S [Escherichia coli]EEV0324223.1 restriction endonuclease subunit S [Escherichia coli]EEV2035545.1 restriction endonuclease subunit S [Escherichia coli]
MSFETIELKELLNEKGYLRGPFGSALKRTELKTSGIPVYEQQHAITGTRTFRYYIDDEKYQTLKRFAVAENDLIISCSGTVGRISIIDGSDPKGIISQALLILRPNIDKITPHFLYYFLTSHKGQREILNAAQGAVQLNIAPRAVVEKISVPVPPREKQDCIVGILKGIDDKIEINTKISESLEQMAQILFKSWFVNFEPVQAKVAVLNAGGSQKEATSAAMMAISGKNADLLEIFERENPEQYAKLKAVAELFPTAMQESELGDIPAGWQHSDLSKLALLNASSWSKKNAPESLRYVDLANTKWGTIHSTEEYLFADAPSRARRILKAGDTIIGTVRPGNGSYAFIAEDNLTGSTGFAVLTPKNPHYSTFIYTCATSGENIDRLTHLADGGAYPAVNADVVLATPCIIPTEYNDIENLISAFHRYVKFSFDYKNNISLQSKKLEELRSILLPKLLSDEIDLSNLISPPNAIMEGV